MHKFVHANLSMCNKNAQNTEYINGCKKMSISFMSSMFIDFGIHDNVKYVIRNTHVTIVLSYEHPTRFYVYIFFTYVNFMRVKLIYVNSVRTSRRQTNPNARVNQVQRN